MHSHAIWTICRNHALHLVAELRVRSTSPSGVRYKEIGHMVGEILAILAVMALLTFFLHEVGSPYHR